MSKFGVVIKQSFYIPLPTLTENNLVDQAGKVHIVPGGYAGCGKELVKILYQKNATIYVAGSNESKAFKFIAAIKDYTVSVASRGSVGVTWAGSLAGMTSSPKGGIQFDAQGNPKVHNSPPTDYGQSKYGNMLLASKLSKRYGKDGIVSASFNPGNLQTEL
ncbi:hypothetical protein HG530_007909 [Fusarium avenaceum]|nr:hypothetical protein HG530_007909 [Fusarium avenaceum]